MTAEQYELITVAIADRVATITFNKPEALNAMGPKMAIEARRALEALDADDAVRVIVLTGAGRAFSSGADLKSGDRRITEAGKPDVLTELREAYNPLIVALRRLGTPVIAAVNGPAVGVSASVACACDLVVAAESAYFLLAFVNIGLTVDGGASYLLPARIGFARSAEMALLGGRIGGQTALGWGLVNRVVPDGELAAAVGELAAKLAGAPPGSLRDSKELLNAACFPELEARLDDEAVRQQRRAESDDFAEGVTALFQKRPANFTGS